MFFAQFIKDPVSVFSQYRVIIVKSEYYSPLFMRALLAKITRDSTTKPQTVDLAGTDIGHIQLKLSTSFLGQRCVYWLGNLGQLSTKSAASFLQFLAGYQAEHTIIAGSTHTAAGTYALIVDCPTSINKKSSQELLSLYTATEQPRIARLVCDVFAHTQTLTLEQTIQLFNYATVLGSNKELFLDQWFDKLIKPEDSLFQLSGFLLAKDNRFWPLWVRMNESYEFPFWLGYFSELFFRAHFYVRYRRQQKLVEAKKIGFRLPFSFLQRDWQNIEPSELQNAHQRLTNIDYQLKNGASPAVLDSLFTTWLASLR